MEIVTLITSRMKTNTYLVFNGERGFVVDPGADADRIASEFEMRGCALEGILITHAHFDHIGAVKALSERYPRLLVAVSARELDFISSRKNMGVFLNVKVEPFIPDILLKGGEEISVAGLKVKVISTPGHSPGGLCYLVGDILFSGDTLFKMSYGRTDLFDGSFRELKNSVINKLFRLNDDIRVLPGHGEETSIAYERKNNPILITEVDD